MEEVKDAVGEEEVVVGEEAGKTTASASTKSRRTTRNWRDFTIRYWGSVRRKSLLFGRRSRGSCLIALGLLGRKGMCLRRVFFSSFGRVGSKC